MTHPEDDEDVSADAGGDAAAAMCRTEGGSEERLRLVTLNVDGLSSDQYDRPANERMEKILDEVLSTRPDVVLLQEVTGPMLATVERRCAAATWKIVKRTHADVGNYFNVTVAKKSWGGTDQTGRSISFGADTDQSRHLLFLYSREWSVTNVHAESGPTATASDKRQDQLQIMSRRHESQHSRGVCVLAGDFNIRPGEEHCLQIEGWRDVGGDDWLPRALPATEDSWTWRRRASSARYDRVLVHGGTDKVECEHFRRLTGIWPVLSDHVGLLVVLRRKIAAPPLRGHHGGGSLSVAASSRGAAAGPTGKPALRHAGSDSAAGHASKKALGLSEGVAADRPKTVRKSKGVGTTEAPIEERRVVRVANAVIHFWDNLAGTAKKSVANLKKTLDTTQVLVESAGYLRKCLEHLGDMTWTLDDVEIGDMALPSWESVPTEGGFRVPRPGGRKATHSATATEQRQQCELYAKYQKWATESCGVTEAELKEHLQAAARLKKDLRGSQGIPSMLQMGNHVDAKRVSLPVHAMLGCRAMGLPRLIGRAFTELRPEYQAVLGGEQWASEATAEFRRLMELRPEELMKACKPALGTPVERLLNEAYEGAPQIKLSQLTRTSSACERAAVVLQLFQLWVLAQAAARLGCGDEWWQSIQEDKWLAAFDAPSHFHLDDQQETHGFSALELMQKWAFQLSKREDPDTNKIKCRNQGFLLAAWWRLAWIASREEVERRFGDGERRLRSTTSFSMVLLYQWLFHHHGTEYDDKLSQIRDSLGDFMFRTTGERLTRQHGDTKSCLRFHKRRPNKSIFTPADRADFWHHAMLAWRDGWCAASEIRPVADQQQDTRHCTNIPEDQVKQEKDGSYTWRGHRAGPGGSFEHCYQILNNKWHEQQIRNDILRRKAKERKAQLLACVHKDKDQRFGPVISLQLSRYKEVFKGCISEQGDLVTFREELTNLQVEVSIPTKLQGRQRDAWKCEQLYVKLRGEHARQRARSQNEVNQKMLQAQLPENTAALTRKGHSKNGKAVFSYGDFEVEATPRNLRPELQEGANSLQQSRAREVTPQRAHRKIMDKMKRAAKKQALGEVERIVARDDDHKLEASNNRCPAAAQLDDPTVLGYLRDSFTFLGSARLHYCKICDEQWPVFDGEWPKSGELTCGPLAGKCETIKRAGFEAARSKQMTCNRCASTKSAYHKQYREENGQHLGPTHEQLNVLTWYESLLIARAHPVISVLTLMSTGMLCYAGHICNYYLKTLEWFNGLPALLHDAKWFLVKRRKSIHATEGESRRKKPTTANRWRLVAAFVELIRCMPNVYKDAEIDPEALRQCTGPGKDCEQEMDATELNPTTRECDLRGEELVKPELFHAWLACADAPTQRKGCVNTSAGRCPCATVLSCFVTNTQGEDARGNIAGDIAWEVVCRHLERSKDTANGEEFAAVLGTISLAALVAHEIDSGSAPEELRQRIYEGMSSDLQRRGKSNEAHRVQLARPVQT